MRKLLVYFIILLAGVSLKGEDLRFSAEGYEWEVVYRPWDTAPMVSLIGLSHGISPLLTEDGVLEIPSAIEYNETTYPVCTIGEGVFKGEDSRFRKVIFPTDLIDICNQNFEGEEIEEIVFNEKLIYINFNCFNNLKNVTTIEFPESLQHIGEECFRNLGVSHLKFPHAKLYVLSWSFSDMDNIESIDFNGLTYLGGVSFCSLPKIRRLELPEEMWEIWDYSFNTLPSLKEVVLPAQVEWQGNRNIFIRCPNLERIYARSATPLPLEAPFGSDPTKPGCLDFNKITLYVPKGSLEAYMHDPAWNVYGQIVEYENLTGISNPTSEIKSDLPTEVYTIAGERIDSSLEEAPSGIYIIRQGSSARKVLKRL